ncbi:class I SAM-dependent methyltransferase [Candidatus Parcubacteria bacterium]|nr:MAG: class I SAM-dependent methyltransferase [Candidatus Parcubacteria bacterium]
MDKKTFDTQRTGLETMSSTIEFADRYNCWFLDKLRPFIGSALLEIGTGHGNFRRYLSAVEKFVSVDIDEKVIERAKEKFPEDTFIVADITSHEFVEKLAAYPIDTVLCVNVLEHVEDAQRAVRNMLAVLPQGGFLLLFVPALPLLYNDLDRLAGHYCRYTKETMRMLIDEPHKIVLLEYFNPVGGVGWWLNKFVKHDSLDRTDVNFQVTFFDRYLVPISRMLNPVTKNFFGQSLICVVKKAS